MELHRKLGTGVAGCAILLLQGAIFAETVPPSGIVSLTVGPKDQAAVNNLSNLRKHALWRPGVTHKPDTLSVDASTLSAPQNDAATIPALPPPGFYPGDLSNPFRGPTVKTAWSHPLYVDCGPNCWGDPAVFLTNLESSKLIHVTDEYVHKTADNRYTVGTAGMFTYPTFAPLGDNDILLIVHAGAFQFGTGYEHMYHVFLPPGVDVCFSGTSECYSPDNPSTFFFCAYHGSVDFSDIGHVLYSVEPFAAVPGCEVQQPSPQGPVVDSTANLLSHELIEMITDPDGDAWRNYYGLAMFGAEIGDECPQAFFAYTPVSINSKKYEVQPEYSNKYHGCAYVP